MKAPIRILLVISVLGLTSCKDDDPATRLFYVAELGNTAECERLVKSGIDVNSTNESGQTPLHWAVGGGNPGTVLSLIEMGAKVDQPDSGGQTPLNLTASRLRGKTMTSPLANRPIIADVLLRHGADVNHANGTLALPVGDTTLHDAAMNKDVALMKLLLAAGADRSIKNAQGLTALDLAEASGYTPDDEVIKLLVAKNETRSGPSN